MKEKDISKLNSGNIVFYTAPDGNVHLEVIFQVETFWLNQKKMADLFNVEINTINYHLKEIFDSGELRTSSTIRKIRIVQKEGGRRVSREVEFYNFEFEANRLSQIATPFGFAMTAKGAQQ